MTEMAGGVSTFQITYAARNSTLDELEIKEGEYLALGDGKLLSADTDIVRIVESIGEAIKETGKETVSIYYGESVSEQEAEKLSHDLGFALGIEVNLYQGGQPVYYYIISAE